MKTFQFPLQRVLEWRELQMRTEEEKLSTIQNKLAEVLHRENALTAAQLNAEMNLLGRPLVEASEFRALAAFQLRIRSEKSVFGRGAQESGNPDCRTAQAPSESPQRLQDSGESERPAQEGLDLSERSRARKHRRRILHFKLGALERRE